VSYAAQDMMRTATPKATEPRAPMPQASAAQMKAAKREQLRRVCRGCAGGAGRAFQCCCRPENAQQQRSKDH